MEARAQGRSSVARAVGGRLRDPELDDAITTAARALLDERGPMEITMEAIARHAGVARATVYRRWPNRDALLAHLLRDLVRAIPVPDHGDVRTDLVELLSEQLRFLMEEAGPRYPTLGVHAAFDDEAAEALRDLVRHRRDALETVLRRGIERGEIRADIDLELSLYLLWGPVYYRYLGALAGRTPIESDFIERLVDAVLPGLATPPPSRGRRR